MVCGDLREARVAPEIPVRFSPYFNNFIETEFMSDPSITNPGEVPAVTPTDDERVLAILAHILTIFFWIFPPLIVYLVKKDQSSFVTEHAKESLNFQLTVGIVAIALIITIIGAIFLIVVGIVTLVLVIIASIKASDKKLYRYPMTIRFIK